MQGKPIPASIAPVLEPLREADGYARLQLQRQKGLYNLLTGLPAFFFLGPAILSGALAAVGISPFLHGPGLFAFGLGMVSMAGWILFFLACFSPQILLPWVRRHRPDWTSPVLESSLLKRALEKLFWLQFPFWLAGLVLPIAVSVLFAIVGLDFLDPFSRISAFLVVVHIAGCASLALQSGRLGDRLLSRAFLAVMPLAVVPYLVDPHHAPSPVGIGILVFALVVPPIVVGLFRLLGPRRWLV